MTVYCLDPLSDRRWVPFLDRHADASVFHTPSWLEALKSTYQFQPVAFTTSPPGSELQNAVVFCRIGSWLTGRRMVSLPFSDHCQPLVRDEESFRSLLSSLQVSFEREKWKYIEMRPLYWPPPAVQSDLPVSPGDRFHFHRLDLRPDLGSLFRGFHKSCIQRKIRRAERENLTYEEGRSTALLDRFYRLLVCTRRRHRLPPQPQI